MSDFRERYDRLRYGSIEISKDSTYELENYLDSMIGSVYNVVYDHIRIPVYTVISFKLFIYDRIDSNNRNISFEYLSSFERLEVAERILEEL